MSIESAAAFVAHTELALEAARETEAHASAIADDISERIAATERKKQKIRSDLAAERIDEAQAAGMFGLADADARDLTELHREALSRVGDAVRQAQEAQAGHHHALTELAKAEATEKFAALTAYAGELDRRLCNAVAELAATAQQAGRPSNSLSAAFMPSQRLTAMIQFRQIPRSVSA